METDRSDSTSIPIRESPQAKVGIFWTVINLGVSLPALVGT